MNQQSRILRGGARAVTGLIVVGACAGAIVALSGITLPSVTRTPIAVTVDTEQNTDRSFVCAGSFSELGADGQRPGAAIPVGTAQVTAAGTAKATSALTRPEGGAGVPAVFSAPSSAPFAAAQIQSVETESLRGVVASACSVPLNEQWLVGGSTTIGSSTTLSLGNPGAVPATVRISVFDEDGPVDAVQTAGVLVAPGREQTVSLNGYATDRERLAVRVESTGAPVTASLGIGQMTGIQPFAVSSVDRQTDASMQLVFPGVSNTSDDEHGPSDSGKGDEIPVVVRVLAPDGGTGKARVFALDAGGKRKALGEIEISKLSVGELRVTTWPEKATTAVIESDIPVVGGVLGSATGHDEHDNEWFAPAPEIKADQQTAAPIVSRGRLVVANTGGTEATVRIESASGKGKAREAKIKAGSSATVEAPADALLTSTAPVHAGVRYLRGGNIAAYPVLPAAERASELTVFPR